MTRAGAEKGRPVRRIVGGQRYGELIVELQAEELLIREKGRRTTSAVSVPYGTLYQWGVEAMVEQRRRLKRRDGRRNR